MNTRERITRSIAGVLAVFMAIGAALVACFFWIGEEDWRGFVEALLALGIAWVFAGYAFAFPGPRTFLRSQWKRIN
jgi:hypothetical protein